MSYSYHGRAWERQQCQQVANQIENQLLNAGAIVHRYDAQSGSVYLKIDYGVGYLHRTTHEVVRSKDGKKVRLYPNYIELARANNSRRQTPKES